MRFSRNSHPNDQRPVGVLRIINHNGRRDSAGKAKSRVRGKRFVLNQDDYLLGSVRVGCGRRSDHTDTRLLRGLRLELVVLLALVTHLLLLVQLELLLLCVRVMRFA